MKKLALILAAFILLLAVIPALADEAPPHYNDIILDFESGTTEGYEPETKITVSDERGFYEAIKDVKPGTGIYFADGIYKDMNLTFELHGTKEKPIVIAAENPGKAVFTGYTVIGMSGEYIEFRDFYFNEVLYDAAERPEFGDNNVFTVKFAKFCRVTNNYFYRCGVKSDPKGEDYAPFKKIIAIMYKSSNNRFDHNTFEDPYSMQIGIYVAKGDDEYNQFNRIDHNYFYRVKSVLERHPGRVENGMESVQIGQGGDIGIKYNKTNTLVEYNLFEDVTGDGAEIISNKSECNVYRYNSFVACDSGFTLRGGNGCIVEGNYLYKVSKGIRIFGANHLIINNYFQECPGYTFDVGMGSAAYGSVKNLTIANNTIIKPGQGCFKLDDGKNPDADGTVPPAGIKVINNHVMLSTGKAFQWGNAANVQVSGNVVELSGSAVMGSDKVTQGVSSEKTNLSQAGRTFEVKSGTPLIDKGTPLPEVTADFYGNPRSQKPDIGCIEFGAGNNKVESLSAHDVGKTWNVKAVSAVDNKLSVSICMMVDNNKGIVKNSSKQIDPENPDVTPIVIDGRTLLPVRFVAESYGALTNWYEPEQKVTVAYQNRIIEMMIGKPEIIIDGKETKLDVPPQVINGRTLIPLRALAEAMGKSVFWDDRGLIIIYEPALTFDAAADKALINGIIELLK